jgi:N-acetylglutamate synthase-like GNAT family acetyltransferase
MKFWIVHQHNTRIYFCCSISCSLSFELHAVTCCAVLQAATRLRAMNSCVVLLTSTLLVGAILVLSISHTAESAALTR